MKTHCALAICFVIALPASHAGTFGGRYNWEDYKATQDGPWTVVTYIEQKVERTNTTWTAKPGTAYSHYSFSLRKLLDQGGDTHLLGRFDPDKKSFDFALHADRRADLGALIAPPESVSSVTPDSNTLSPMDVGHYYHLVFGPTHVLCQILTFNPNAKTGENLGNLSVSFRYLVSQSGIADLNQQLSLLKRSSSMPPQPSSPTSRFGQSGGGFSFKAIVYSFFAGVATPLLLIGVYLVKSAKRAGKGVFDFLATGWLGTRGMDALARRGKKD